MITTFRWVAILEGISYLALFLIGMPLKYGLDIHEPNIWIGYAHGFLFMAYVALAIITCFIMKWSFGRFCIFFIAALLPLVPFYVERKYLRI